jgi:serine/threonine protein kinase
MDHEFDEEEEEIYLRGIIQGSESKYYILNEIFSEEDCKQLSAIKILKEDLTKPDSIRVDEHKYSVRCYDKKWISQNILNTVLKVGSDKTHKFFDCFKNKFEENRSINHYNIQQMKEYIDTDDYIYVITEYSEQNLQDYIIDVKDKCKYNSTQIELKLRKVFQQIFTAMFELFDLCGCTFGGLLSAREIMIIEKEKKDIIIKFPHPFFANFQTILKFFTPNFPYYLAPEVYELFRYNNFTSYVMKKDTYDFSNLFTVTDLNFDMWAIAFMMYETFFHSRPYEYNNLSSATKTLNSNAEFILIPNLISDVFMKIIEQGLKIDMKNRLSYKDFKMLIDQIEIENNSYSKFEEELLERIRDDVNFSAIGGTIAIIEKKEEQGAAANYEN